MLRLQLLSSEFVAFLLRFLPSVQSKSVSLSKVNLPVPTRAFEIEEGDIRTAIAIFPGLNKSGELISSGTLEDLCLEMIKEESILACAEAFLECCRKNNADIQKEHKMKLHAYLAGQSKYAGMKLGEASKANAWNWQHPQMKPFEELLRGL